MVYSVCFESGIQVLGSNLALCTYYSSWQSVWALIQRPSALALSGDLLISGDTWTCCLQEGLCAGIAAETAMQIAGLSAGDMIFLQGGVQVHQGAWDTIAQRQGVRIELKRLGGPVSWADVMVCSACQTWIRTGLLTTASPAQWRQRPKPLQMRRGRE